MKRRVARLLEGGQAARRILAVTFTRNAAAILQEQRRLFYVALTRCTEILVVSSATQMARNFAWKIGARVVPGSSQYARTVASQFLDELGPSAPVAIPGANWQY
jgi:ATP-dependent DNA helicase UvrD/PcrA